MNKRFLFGCMTILIASCSNNRQRTFYEKEIGDIRNNLILHEQAMDTLMFASYTDDNIPVNVHFDMDKKKTLVIKTSNFDCDECLDMVMHEIADGHWTKSIPIELWYEGEYKNSGILYKDWYPKLKNEIRFRELSSELNNLSSNGKGKPFLFIYDSGDREISHLFFPITGKKSAIAEYCGIMKNKFFTKQEAPSDIHEKN
jgi:hypothetical protein